MNRLGIPQERIAKILGEDQKIIYNHLGKMPVLANFLNSDLSRGFTTVQDVSPILYQNMTKMVDG